MLNGLSMCNDVVTVLPTLLITVNKNDLKDLSNEEQQMLSNNTELMRSNEEVMLIYLEHQYWKRYKHVMVENIMADKVHKSRSDDLGSHDYQYTEEYYDFMRDHGCFIFSGSGFRFPEVIETPESPFNMKEVKKSVGFGRTFTPASALVNQAKQKAEQRLGISSKQLKPMKF